MQTTSIDAHTGLIGLFGNPVGHSVSPAIHTCLSKATGQNLCYLAFPIEKSLLGDAVKGMFALGAKGLNVTVPYKKDVMEHLVDIDEKAAQIGAVNTLVRMENGFKGYNTDMPGLYRAMQYDGVTLEGQDVVILGAGGVANAVLCMALVYGARRVLLVNRSLAKAEDLITHFKTFYPDADMEAISLSEDIVAKMDAKGMNQVLCFQATNIGMHPNCDETVVSEEAFYKRVAVGYDMIFNPYDTKFMQLVRAQGGKAFNGLRMLLFQGILAYELWTGEKINDSTAEETLAVLKLELGIKE